MSGNIFGCHYLGRGESSARGPWLLQNVLQGPGQPPATQNCVAALPVVPQLRNLLEPLVRVTRRSRDAPCESVSPAGHTGPLGSQTPLSLALHLCCGPLTPRRVPPDSVLAFLHPAAQITAKLTLESV